MSKSDGQENSNVLQEKVQKLVIQPEDCTGAGEFWVHFDVPITNELKQAFSNFCSAPTIENQREVRLRVCQALGHTAHAAFNDEMFKEIVDECRNQAYDMTFDKSLEAALTPEDKKPT